MKAQMTPYLKDDKSNKEPPKNLKKGSAFSTYRTLFILVLNFFITAAIIFFLSEAYLEDYMKAREAKIIKTLNFKVEKNTQKLNKMQASLKKLEEGSSSNSIIPANQDFTSHEVHKIIEEELKDLKKELLEVAVLDKERTLKAKGIDYKLQLIQAIRLGQPLELIHQDRSLPPHIKQHLVGMSAFPTYDMILHRWYLLKPKIQIQKRSFPTKDISWYNRLKSFIKSVVQVERIDKNRLTLRENMVEKLEGCLIGKDMAGFKSYTDLYKQEVEVETKRELDDLVHLISQYEKGQAVIRLIQEEE